jgi:hypothetical protein
LGKKKKGTLPLHFGMGKNALIQMQKKENRDKRLSLEIDCEYKTGWEQLFSLSTSLKTTTPQNH